MLEIREVKLPIEAPESELLRLAAKRLGIKQNRIKNLKIRKKAIDARKKQELCYVYTLLAELDGEEKFLSLNGVRQAEIFEYEIPSAKRAREKRPVIVGFGPAGMFSALVLARAGLRPIVIERGEAASERQKKVREFWESGKLDTDSNVQFGEGGAGTFSDGKLNTGTHNPRIGWVLSELAAFGAPENICYDSKPHIGTDILVELVQRIRKEIESLGAEVRFNTKLTGLKISEGRLHGIEVQNAEGKHEIDCEELILAIGHSARDTFEMLNGNSLPMERKPFSMGLRIEHRQEDIGFAQYGEAYSRLPAADYKLSCRLPNGDSAYTFCMCPGGVVAAAASEAGQVVTNGMSYSGRDKENANSALLVTLLPEDFPYEGVLGGVEWQREIEKAAFELGGGNYRAPAQLVGDFLKGKASHAAGKVRPSYMSGVTFTDIRKCLPEKICDTLAAAIPLFAKKLKGFDDPEAVLTAPETRSSSPVRILRGENRQSQIAGIYPVGEGAGYAGGIVSSAVDGMLTAETILEKE